MTSKPNSPWGKAHAPSSWGRHSLRNRRQCGLRQRRSGMVRRQTPSSRRIVREVLWATRSSEAHATHLVRPQRTVCCTEGLGCGERRAIVCFLKGGERGAG